MPTRSPTLVGPPPSDDVVTSALLDTHSVLTDSAYSDYIVQRSSDNVSFLDTTNTIMSQRTDQLFTGLATRTSTASAQLLADLPRPPHICRQPLLPECIDTPFDNIVPLLSDRTQTTASEYVNTDVITSLPVHRYADTPIYANTMPYSSAPLSQVTQPVALYAASYASDLHSLSMVAFQPIVRSSYADNSQRLPIAVEQASFSAFSRIDVPTAHLAPLQSPSVHWRKRLAYPAKYRARCTDTCSPRRSLWLHQTTDF